MKNIKDGCPSDSIKKLFFFFFFFLMWDDFNVNIISLEIIFLSFTLSYVAYVIVKSKEDLH